MARSGILNAVTRAMRMGRFADTHGLRTRDVIELSAEHAEKRHINRRQFIGGVAGATALSAVGALAVPKKWLGGPEIAIIGGGLAGLTCAQKLAANGYNARIFEANPSRLGGRVSTAGMFLGQVAELGGEFIDTTHKALLGYVNMLGLTLEDVAKAPGEVTYRYFGQNYKEEEVVDEFRELAKRMRPDMKHIGSPTAFSFNAQEEALDLMDMATYLDSRAAGLSLIRAVLDTAYTIEYGRQIHEQSALALLLFIHLDGRRKFAPFGVFSDERYHIVGGNDQLAYGLAQALPAPIEMGAKLTALSKNASGRYVMTFENSTTEEADIVVLTLPFSVLKTIQLDSSLGLEPQKIQTIQNYVYGTNAKTMIGFNGRPWWDLHGSNGAVYSDEPNVQASWETSWTTAGVHAVLTDYSGGDRALALQQTSPTAPWGKCGSCHGGGSSFFQINDTALQQQADAFLTDLDKALPGVKAKAVQTISETGDAKYVVARGHWWSQSTSRGSYTCNPPGYFTQVAGWEAKSYGGLKFAGEHTNSFYEWQGFMEGACLSGIAAADEILGDIKKGKL